MQACVGQQVCRELDDVDTPQALHYKIKEGVSVCLMAWLLAGEGRQAWGSCGVGSGGAGGCTPPCLHRRSAREDFSGERHGHWQACCAGTQQR